jgi:O-acetyl-ADP-ribose deacetylase
LFTKEIEKLFQKFGQLLNHKRCILAPFKKPFMKFNNEVLWRIELHKGDITKFGTDAIVNAANRSLLGGGGVDGAIHRAAGPQLLAECRRLNGCEVGEAKITRGYDLPARHVIHTVGPVWRGGTAGEAEMLALCYRNSLLLAKENNLHSITFPSISTGAYGYPIEEAARIAVTEAAIFLSENQLPHKVLFTTFSQYDLDMYHEALNSLRQ